MNPSLRRQLMLYLLSLGLLVWFVISLKSYFDIQDETNKLFDAQLSQSARALLALTAHELVEHYDLLAQHGTPADIPEEITRFEHRYEQKIAFQIWIGSDRLAVRSSNAPRQALTSHDNLFEDKIIENKRWRVFAIWDSERQVQVQVGEDYDRRSQVGTEVSWHIITTITVILPLLALVVWFSVGRAMKPLERLARQVSSREFDNLQPVPTSQVPVEALPLIDALNGLFSRLQLAFDNIRRFTGDAAHELRTPLSALKTHAQIAVQSKDTEVIREAARHLLDGTERASHLVEQMLTLARLDPDSNVIKYERVDICTLVQEEIALLDHKAVDKHLDISLDSPDHLWLDAKPALLATLIRNLVVNAINYTPIGGKIEVSIRESADSVELCVADNGPGIPEAERQEVFKRFYRGKGVEAQGTGLGLSIVERILQLHHGSIRLERAELGGLQVVVGLKGNVNSIQIEDAAQDRMAG